jgi:hypothetical protein
MTAQISTPRPRREFGRKIPRIAQPAGEIRRPHSHGGPQCFAIATERKTGVIGNVEPFVRVRRAHESAPSSPATSWASFGETAAQRSKAPSTCTQAPASFALGTSSDAGSNAPVFRFPPGDRRSQAL